MVSGCQRLERLFQMQTKAMSNIDTKNDQRKHQMQYSNTYKLPFTNAIQPKKKRTPPFGVPVGQRTDPLGARSDLIYTRQKRAYTLELRTYATPAPTAAYRSRLRRAMAPPARSSAGAKPDTGHSAGGRCCCCCRSGGGLAPARPWPPTRSRYGSAVWAWASGPARTLRSTGEKPDRGQSAGGRCCWWSGGGLAPARPWPPTKSR